MLTLLGVAQLLALGLLIARLLPGRLRIPAVPPGSSIDGEPASVSVIVATLNEANRLQPCLDGLIAQGAVVREILVVDSDSRDGTAELVRAAERRDPRVKLLRDDPLPAGWVGKVWALQHGLASASGEWVLGMDADTIPHPGLAAGAVGAALAHGYDAVSFSPRFRTSGPAERWLQPAMLMTLIYRFGAAGGDAGAGRVMANGQCFLARRRVLEDAGGYRAARESFCDDVTLARELAARGHRVGFLDGSRLYDVASYASVGEMWREWGRSIDLKDAATSSLRQWMDVMFIAVVQGLPIPLLLWALALTLAGVGTSAAVVRWTLVILPSVALGVRWAMQLAVAASYREHGVAFWLSPLADPLAAVRILVSTMRRPTGWRGRTY